MHASAFAYPSRMLLDDLNQKRQSRMKLAFPGQLCRSFYGLVSTFRYLSFWIVDSVIAWLEGYVDETEASLILVRGGHCTAVRGGACHASMPRFSL